MKPQMSTLHHGNALNYCYMYTETCTLRVRFDISGRFIWPIVQWEVDHITPTIQLQVQFVQFVENLLTVRFSQQLSVTQTHSKCNSSDRARSGTSCWHLWHRLQRAVVLVPLWTSSETRWWCQWGRSLFFCLLLFSVSVFVSLTVLNRGAGINFEIGWSLLT